MRHRYRPRHDFWDEAAEMAVTFIMIPTGIGGIVVFLLALMIGVCRFADWAFSYIH